MEIDREFLTRALSRLAADGGDSVSIEAKTFSEYSAAALGPTLSAFANRPGGGTILLGVSENPVEVRGLTDPHATAQRLSNQARTGLSVPVQIDVANIVVDDRTVTVGYVHEVDVNDKPCVWKRDGQAYLRQYDGDYRMSEHEKQQLLRRHLRPREDAVAVPGTSVTDLEPELLARFLRAARSGSTALREASQDEILHRLNVLTASGELTIAGLYALGIYPQQHLPQLSIRAAVIPDHGERARDSLVISGPLPDMLDEAVAWVERVTSTAVVVGEDGHARDIPEFPPVAVRELVANALIHRDLSEPALSKCVDIRLTREHLIITSPGGLWSLTVSQLGMHGGRSAVNEFLYMLGGFVSDADGRRVIEGLGTGIAAVRRALESAGLSEPLFDDSAVRFTVRLPRPTRQVRSHEIPRASAPVTEPARTSHPAETNQPGPVARPGIHTNTVWDALALPATIAQLIETTGLTRRQVSYALKQLIDAGQVHDTGEYRRRSVVYARTAPAAP